MKKFFGGINCVKAGLVSFGLAFLGACSESSSSVEAQSDFQDKKSAQSMAQIDSSTANSMKTDVRAFQYEFGKMDFLFLQVSNNGNSALEGLELRLYVTATPEEMETAFDEGDSLGSCPIVVDSDICQTQDSMGFAHPCVNAAGEYVSDEIISAVRATVPVKIKDSYNPTSGEYGWYIPIPMSSLKLDRMSSAQLNISFTSGINQNGTCETLRVPAKKRFGIPNAGDWSWKAHSEEDGANYEGMPLEEDYSADVGQAAVNPYITVYSNGVRIWGFEP